MHQCGVGDATSHRDDFARPFVPTTCSRVRALCTVSRGRATSRGMCTMVLIVAFAITVLAGDLVAIGICTVVEQFSKPISLFLFLILFAGVIPFAWRIAVRATEPDGPIMRLPIMRRLQ